MLPRHAMSWAVPLPSRQGSTENQKVEFYVTEARRTQAANVRPVA